MHAGLIPLVALAAVYALGLRALWRDGVRRAIRGWEAACFAAGATTIAFALFSPLHHASEELFTAHMIQHELLMVVAAPLLVLGRPAMAALWAIPAPARSA